MWYFSFPYQRLVIFQEYPISQRGEEKEKLKGKGKGKREGRKNRKTVQKSTVNTVTPVKFRKTSTTRDTSHSSSKTFFREVEVLPFFLFSLIFLSVFFI